MASHDDLDELAMAVDDAQIRDRAQELRHLADLLADRPDEGSLGGRVVAEPLFPEPEEGTRLSSLWNGNPFGSPLSAVCRSADRGVNVPVKRSMTIL